MLGQLGTQYLPREMSSAVFQLTEPSLTPTVPRSQGFIPTAQTDAPPVTEKFSLNTAESLELF